MELESRRYYERAISQVTDASTRKLLGGLADAERQRYATAESLERGVSPEVRESEEASNRRLFVL